MSDDANLFFLPDADWIGRVKEKRAQLVAQRDHIDSQIATLDSSLAEMSKLSASVSRLIGDPIVSNGNAETLEAKNVKETRARRPKKMPRFVKVAGKLVTFASEIKKVVDPAGRGVHYDDIKETVLSGPLGDKMRVNTKAYYTALGRLIHDEGYVKHKGHLFTKEHYDDLMTKVLLGEEEDVIDASVNRKPSMVDAVLSAVRESEAGIAPKDVISVIFEKLQLPDSSKNNVYNALTRLAERGDLKKVAGLYFPVNKNGPPEKVSQKLEVGTLF